MAKYDCGTTHRSLAALLAIAGMAISAAAIADALPDAVTASPDVY